MVHLVGLREEVPGQPAPEKRCRLWRWGQDQLAFYDTSRLK